MVALAFLDFFPYEQLPCGKTGNCETAPSIFLTQSPYDAIKKIIIFKHIINPKMKNIHPDLPTVTL